MNRADRRYKTKIKTDRRLKRYWQRFGNTISSNINLNGGYTVSSLADAVKVKEETKRKYHKWIDSVKNKNISHRKDAWETIWKKTLHHKEKILSTKEMKVEVDECINYMNNPFYFENFCGSCDHFPSLKNQFETSCPFKERFANGELFSETNWKELKCENF